MRKTTLLSQRSLIGIVAVLLTGCMLRPNLVSAHLKKGEDKTEIVEVVLPAGDAKKIRDREIFFSIVLVDCRNHENRFPIEPYIDGRRASKFDFSVAGEFVIVQGEIPNNILSGFPTPCVALQGGSYILGRLDAPPVPLVRLAK